MQFATALVAADVSPRHLPPHPNSADSPDGPPGFRVRRGAPLSAATLLDRTGHCCGTLGKRNSRSALHNAGATIQAPSGSRWQLAFGKSWKLPILSAAILGALLAVAVTAAETPEAKSTVQELSRQLWPKARLEQARREVDQQKADGLLSEAAYARRAKLIEARLAGTYKPESLAVADPPLNFIQNGGFELTNPNSAKNRSRWLWWNGWSWGGDYENMWEDRPEYVHSGKLSARIKCTGAKGRIGINTPPLPAIPAVTEYKLTFWARGEGDNMIFINFEEGANGTLREKIPAKWTPYTVIGKPVEGKKAYNVFFYVIGEGAIWLDDAELVPVGGKLDE
jgi:hypothetical protein